MTFIELAERAKEQLTTVTGLKPVLVSATFKNDEGWHVFVDMLELRRIPDSTDVLGYYEVLLDDNGNMLQFKRKRNHLRGESVEEMAEN
ncbi:MAG: gas vesicle protein GvpO [Dehalococcoidia bacterium]|nr:gas vesicle protein GvpO [Dehalococcoidia bacterium]